MPVRQGFDPDEGMPTYGSFTVRLKPETPPEIRKAAFGSHELYEFGWNDDTICITPTRLRDPGATATTIFSKAVYSGMIDEPSFGRMSDPWSVSGTSIMAWLGKPSSPPIGPVGFGPYTINNDFATIMVALFSTPADVGGMDLYSAATCSGNTIADDTVEYEVAIETIKRYMRQTTDRTEMWVRPDRGVHFAAQGNSAIFAQTPEVLFTSGDADAGINGDLFVIPGSTFTKTRSTKDHALGVAVKASGGSVSSALGTPTRYASDGSSAPSTMAYYESSAADVGLEVYTLQNDRHRAGYGHFNVNVTCDVPCILSQVIPGDWVYLHDPDTYTVDSSNEVFAGGRLLYPLALRATEVNMPITAGMGVYHIANSSASPSANAVLDLSDWVDYETGPTSVQFDTLGMALRRYFKDFAVPNPATSSW